VKIIIKRIKICSNIITYEENDIIENKYGIKSVIGYDEIYKKDVWIAYYLEDHKWEIERYLNDIEDWKAYCFSLERRIKELKRKN